MWASQENPLLGSHGWNDKNNKKIEAELEAKGELNLYPVPDDRTGAMVPRDWFQQVEAEYLILRKANKKAKEPDLRKQAQDIVRKRQRPEPRNAGAYDDLSKEMVRIKRENPELPLMGCLTLAKESLQTRSRVLVEGEAMTGESALPEGPERLNVASLMNARARVHSGGGKGNQTMYRSRLSGRLSLNPDGSVEQVQALGARSSGGGGSKGRKRSRKKNPWFCTACFLEFCIHRPTGQGRGRPLKDPANPRTNRVRNRMSDKDKALIKSLGISGSDALALFSRAIREKLPLEQVVLEWQQGSAA